MNPQDPQDQADRIKDAVFRGNKIEAIKIYREQTGVGLAEAKKAVEIVEDELRASSPARFAPTAGKGCSVSSGVLLAIAGILVWLLTRS